MDRIGTKIKLQKDHLDEKLYSSYVKAMQNKEFEKLVRKLHLSEGMIQKNVSK